MKALQPGLLLQAQFILKALCILTVKMDIPYEVSVWLNFAVSSLRSSTFCSLKHAHTHTHTQSQELYFLLSEAHTHTHTHTRTRMSQLSTL